MEITKPGQFNNGNIEVIQPETPTAPPPKMLVDEVLINGRRYRVPERVITMDFWNKTGRGRPHREECVEDPLILCETKHACSDSERISSAVSSPLTSLSSVDPMDEDDIEDIEPKVSPEVSSRDSSLRFDLDQLKAAFV